MQWLQFTVCVAVAVAHCMLIGCESRPSSLVPMSRPYSVDCGSYQNFQRSTKAAQRPRAMSLVSSLLRQNFFGPSTYKRTYTCWRAANVSELCVVSSTSAAMESVIQFSVDKSSLENITGARLTLSMVDGSEEESQDQLGAVQVVGVLPGYLEHQIMIPEVEEETPVSSSNKEVRNFDVLDFLRNTPREEKTFDIDADNEMEAKNEKVTVKFYVTRRSDNETIDDCPDMFDTTIHTPSLRVFYV